jgi:hypothetical protein
MNRRELAEVLGARRLNALEEPAGGYALATREG